MKEFIKEHFDAIITVLITVVGFLVTYFMTKKNFKDEIKKNKIELNTEAIKELPYEICQLMNRIIAKGEQKPFSPEEYSDLLSKLLAYGSKSAISIAVYMQQFAYSLNQNNDPHKHWEMLAAYALLISQVKFDLTSEAISPLNWFKMRLTDYDKNKDGIIKIINRLIKELELNPQFCVHE